jgi:cytochrome oxidase Cu insertion factor (SCO1/SenC/PrrC family)
MTPSESSEATPTIGGPDEHVSTPPRRRGPGPVAIVIMAVAVLAAAVFVVLAVRHHDQGDALSSIRPTGIPATVPTSLANLMALSPIPTHPAPNFTLVDQNGHTLSLASFKGQTVVLEFMDPHCTDICPIVSQEFVDAYHDLGKDSSRVAFVAVNVNQYYTGVSAMASFSNEQRLNTIPSWHFLTGSVKDLKSVWSNYGIEVEAPNPNADIVHTSIVYFIDPKGHERYLGAPMDDHTASGASYLPANQLASWGQGIAFVARSLTS